MMARIILMHSSHRTHMYTVCTKYSRYNMPISTAMISILVKCWPDTDLHRNRVGRSINSKRGQQV